MTDTPKPMPALSLNGFLSLTDLTEETLRAMIEKRFLTNPVIVDGKECWPEYEIVAFAHAVRTDWPIAKIGILSLQLGLMREAPNIKNRPLQVKDDLQPGSRYGLMLMPGHIEASIESDLIHFIATAGYRAERIDKP